MPDQAAPSSLTFEIESTGGTAVVRCHGRLVSGVDDVLYTRVKELIPHHRHIVLDLTDVARVDSIGLGTLVRLYVSARSADCDLELINLGRQVSQLLQLTNLLSVFSVVGEHGIKIG